MKRAIKIEPVFLLKIELLTEEIDVPDAKPNGVCNSSKIEESTLILSDVLIVKPAPACLSTLFFKVKLSDPDIDTNPPTPEPTYLNIKPSTVDSSDSFKNLNKYFKAESIDGIIYDLGTCSTHFDNPNRGFSFNKDGPLDMRFDNTKGNSLSDWLNKAPVEKIISVLYKYGDEKHAKFIAKTIEDERKRKPILRTCQLAEIISQKYPEKKKKIHPATKSFQAFRIFINNELEEFELSLNAAKNILKKDGIVVTIAFHSLEDNIIKNFFKPSLKSFPKDIPLNNIEEKNFKCVAKKIRPSDKELQNNSRSRSAIMRVFQKI